MKPGEPTMPSASEQGATIEVHAEAYCSACNQSFPSDTTTCPNDGARLIKLAAQRDDLIGMVLDERYEIRAPLGKGGMGTVYRGWQLSVDREVAIKVIHPKLADDRSAVKRFLREARLASRLSQPNIVNVYDFGQSDNVLYLVMELLRGRTLGSELGQGRRINPKRTIAIALQLCDALEAAHAQGIVHRDLKPSNIVILDDPPGRDLIKVLDFGLAKSLVQDAGSVVTNTDALLGTPLYMAPEQIEGKPSDQRADLYSLGCILYEMLTGTPPFIDNAVSAVLARHMTETAAVLPTHVPPRLRVLVEGLLAKSPEMRIQTAGDVLRTLEDIRDSPTIPTPQPFDTVPAGPSDTIPDVEQALAETHAVTPLPASSVASSPVGASSASGARVFAAATSPEAQPLPASGRRWAIVAALAIGALAGGIALFALQSPATESTASPGSNATVVPAAPLDAASAGGAPVAQVDAGVLVEDAAIAVDAAVVDAAIKKATPRPKPPRPPPVVRVDAGADLPDLDFVKKKKL